MTPSNQHNHKSEVDYGSIPTDSFDKATILDQIDPLVLERENALKKKKLGGAAFVAVLLVIVAGMAALTGKDTGAWDDPKSLLENRFSSLLVDDKAFFFPSTVADDGRRALEAADDSGNPWALAWADNKDSFAAVGAYYRAKGKALAHYYKSSYDPKYNKTAEEAGVANVTLNETAPWSFDWKTDSQAGIALAQKYKSIGDTIDEHYKQAFDPTYSISTGNPSDRRFLRTLAKADEDESTPSYDWAADRDRGMSIGQHFKELGQEIKEHYQGQFGELANVDAAAPLDWSTTWMDFKAKGLAIGKYYQDKGVAISRFYEQQPENINKPLDAVSSQKAGFVPLGALSAASIAGAAPASSDPDAAANAKNDWYIWGMDWQNGKEEAMNLHEEMKSKGQAIANYYRAKFDPTFFANAAELVSNSLDNLSFPSWGENAEADKAHGKEIGEYWASHGKQVGKEPKGLLTTQRVDQVDSGATSAPADFWKEQGVSWKDRGQSIGKYWENFYRSRFDPTYDSKEDMN